MLSRTRAAEQERLLRHDGQLLAQRALRHVAHVVAVDEDFAHLRVVETGEQLDDRRLAGAGGAHERDSPTCRDDQVDVVQHRVVGVVPEGDAAELDLPAGIRQVDGVRRIQHVRVGVEHCVDLLHCRHRRLEGVVELAELLQRVEEAVQVGDEGDEHADLQRLVGDQRAAVPEDDDHGDPGHELDEGEVEAALHDGAHVDVAVGGVGDLQPFVVALLAAERLEHAHPRDRLLQVRAHVADLVADLSVGACGRDCGTGASRR